MVSAAHQPELSSDQIVNYCRTHMEWAIETLRVMYPGNQDAEEYAGIGLFEAARTYDQSKGVPFRGWAYNVLRWTARDEMRRFNGRTGSRRHEINCQSMSIAPWDQDDRADRTIAHAVDSPDSRMISDEQTAAIIRDADRIDDATDRIVALGLVMEFETRDIARMLHVGKLTIKAHAYRVRRSLADA